MNEYRFCVAPMMEWTLRLIKLEKSVESDLHG